MSTFEELEAEWETWQRLSPNAEFREFLSKARWLQEAEFSEEDFCVIGGCIMLSHNIY